MCAHVVWIKRWRGSNVGTSARMPGDAIAVYSHNHVGVSLCTLIAKTRVGWLLMHASISSCFVENFYDGQSDPSLTQQRSPQQQPFNAQSLSCSCASFVSAKPISFRAARRTARAASSFSDCCCGNVEASGDDTTASLLESEGDASIHSVL